MRTLCVVLGLWATLCVSGCDLQQNVAARGDVGGANPVMAPVIAGTLLSLHNPGSHFDLGSLRGHPVVIDFWGSWCGPCRAEQPDLNALAQRWSGRGVVFVGVAMRDDPASVRAYLASYSVPYGTVMDTDESIAGNYNVVSPPTAIVVDAGGHVAKRFLGTTVGIGDLLQTLTAANTATPAP